MENCMHFERMYELSTYQFICIVLAVKLHYQMWKLNKHSYAKLVANTS